MAAVSKADLVPCLRHAHCSVVLGIAGAVCPYHSKARDPLEIRGAHTRQHRDYLRVPTIKEDRCDPLVFTIHSNFTVAPFGASRRTLLARSKFSYNDIVCCEQPGCLERRCNRLIPDAVTCRALHDRPLPVGGLHSGQLIMPYEKRTDE